MAAPRKRFLLYGATGYTGELIAREAAARGLAPVLSGRNEAAVRSLGAGLGLDVRPAALERASELDAALDDVALVLHCAGPFVHTASPMAEACLRRRVHYLDITGEIPVFEALAARHGEAVEAGIALIPGVGFDVVPTDALAAHLARRLPSASRLELAVAMHSTPSRGTALTMLEALVRGEGAMVRRGGRLLVVPLGTRTLEIDFGDRRRVVTLASWGDVATAWYSTGIPDIDVYMTIPALAGRLMPAARWILALGAVPPVAALARAVVRARAQGPDAHHRATGECRIWGRATDAAGVEVVSRMRTPEGYRFTIEAALRIVERVLDGHWKPGFHTPSRLFGPDFPLQILGVEREDLDGPSA